MARGRSTRGRWSWTGLLFALSAAALWGLAPVATKAALAGFSPEFIGFFRLGVAALLFRVLAGETARWFDPSPWVWVAGVGLGADFILYNYGVQRTTANVAGLVINVELVSTIALAVWLLGEQLSKHRMVGSAVTLAGVLAVTVDNVRLADLIGGGRIVGNVLVMAAGISWSLFAVAQRRAGEGANIFRRLLPIFVVATLTTAPPLLLRGAWTITGGLMPTAMLMVLTVLGTGLVYWVYARSQQLIDVSVLAILLCSIPVFTVLFAYVLLGETVTQRLLIGGALIVAGIIVIAMEKVEVQQTATAFTEEVRNAVRGT